MQLPPITSEYVSMVGSTNNLSPNNIIKRNKGKQNSTLRRMNTFTLDEDQILKISESPGPLSSKKLAFSKETNLSDRLKANNNIYNTKVRKRRTVDMDVQSTSSLLTGPYSNPIEDPMERKRSASAGLIREKKTVNRKKKLKSLNAQQKKPTWNNNFNTRSKCKQLIL